LGGTIFEHKRKRAIAKALLTYGLSDIILCGSTCHFCGQDGNWEGPLKAWTSNKRCGVFVVHNSAYSVVLVAVGAALGGGVSDRLPARYFRH